MKVIAEKVNATVWYVVCIVLLVVCGLASIWGLSWNKTITVKDLIVPVCCAITAAVLIVLCVVDYKRPNVLIALDDNNTLVLSDGRTIPLLQIFNVKANIYRNRYMAASSNGDVVFEVMGAAHKYNLLTCEEQPDKKVLTETIKVEGVKNCNDIVRTIIRLVSELRADTDPNTLLD